MSNFLTEKTTSGLNLNPDIDSFEIPESEYPKILNGMVAAFFGRRKDCDSEAKTEMYCREVLKQCSSGFKKNGKVWRDPPGKDSNDWYEKLSLRLKVFGYDISTNSLIGKRDKISSKIKGLSEKKGVEDPNDRTFSLREKVAFDEFIEKFRGDFAGSTTVADELMIRRLAFLSVLNERDIEYVSLSSDLTKQIKDLAESLGVSGKQRKTVFNNDGMGTLELLSTKFKRTVEEHIEIEALWKAEEAKLIINAVDRGTLEEFLAQSWFVTLYGKTLNDKPISMDVVRDFLKENKWLK